MNILYCEINEDTKFFFQDEEIESLFKIGNKSIDISRTVQFVLLR